MNAPEVNTAEEPVPWCVFIRFLRRPAQPNATGEGCHSRSQAKFNDELLQLLQQEYPWLTIAEIMQLLKMNSPQASVEQPRASPLTSCASSSSAGQGSSRFEAQELPEDVVAAVHENLEAIRAEVAQGNLEVGLTSTSKSLVDSGLSSNAGSSPQTFSPLPRTSLLPRGATRQFSQHGNHTAPTFMGSPVLASWRRRCREEATISLEGGWKLGPQCLLISTHLCLVTDHLRCSKIGLMNS